MCGIIGAVVPHKHGLHVFEKIKSALSQMRYRGPDSEGTLQKRSSSATVILGHRRLSILDLSSRGHQPMEFDSLSITYNGEIYNYKELRESLIQKGHTFKSDTDTEVILHGYAEKGTEFIQELRGIFAFAIYDAKVGNLVLARDRTGIKPLFYCEENGSFYFSSESKYLCRFMGSTAFDELSFSYFFQLGYTPPGRSIFKNIFKLLPGQILKIDVQSMSRNSTTFYRLPCAREKISSVDLKGLEQDVASTVSEQMIADVPLGVYLSGGLDSTIVTMLAAKSNPHLTAFTTRFHTKDSYIKFNLDYEMAVLASKTFGIKLEVVDIDEQDPNLLDLFVSYLKSLDEPHANSTTFSTLLIAKRAHEIGFKVLLSGDGADEIFGGYGRYEKARTLHRWYPLCLLHPKAAHFFKGSTFQRYLQWYKLFSSNQLKLLMKQDLKLLDEFSLEEASPAIPDAVNYYDLQYWISEESNTRTDRAGMLNSVEIRVPFQDHRLIDKYWPVPLKYKMHGNKRKLPLLKAFENRVPREIIERKKSGWNAPDSKWFRAFLKPYILDLLSYEKIKRQGLFSPDYVQKIVDSHMKGEYFRNQLKTLLAFQTWYDTCIDSN